MLLYRVRCFWLALVLAIAFSAVGAQSTIPSETNKVFKLREVYQNGLWTVAFAPGAVEGAQAPHQRWYHLISPGNVYKLQSPPAQNDFCFVVSHKSSTFSGQASYIGIASFSILKESVNPDRPVSMYRNSGWKRGNSKLPDDRLVNSKLRPTEFFLAHANPGSLKDLDAALDYKWHGQYGVHDELNGGHDELTSWTERDIWDLSEEVHDVLGIELDGHDPKETRFDGKLIRFKFTNYTLSTNPPRFCLRKDSRLITSVTLFGPHITDEIEFYIDWSCPAFVDG